MISRRVKSRPATRKAGSFAESPQRSVARALKRERFIALELRRASDERVGSLSHLCQKWLRLLAKAQKARVFRQWMPRGKRAVHAQHGAATSRSMRARV